LVRGDAIARHADDPDARLAEPGVQVAKILRFTGAAGGHVLRVEVDDQLLARGVLQSPGAPAGRRQGEVGGLAPDLGGAHQDFTGSRMASRFSESQNSMNSSRRWATWMRLGTLTIICTENIGAPVCAAG